MLRSVPGAQEHTFRWNPTATAFNTSEHFCKGLIAVSLR